MNKKIGNIFKGDKVIWMVFFFLCMISIVEVFSASSNLTYKSQNYIGPIAFHTVTIVIGALVAVVTLNIPCRYFKLMTPFLLIISGITLLWVLVGGESINGANRVISLPGGITFQPSEIAKGTMVLITAQILSAMQREDGADKKAFKYILWIVVPTAALIGIENLSTAALLLVVIFLMMFIGRIPMSQMGKLVGAAGFVIAVFLTLVLTLGSIGADEEKNTQTVEAVSGNATDTKVIKGGGVFHRFVTWRNRIIKHLDKKKISCHRPSPTSSLPLSLRNLASLEQHSWCSSILFYFTGQHVSPAVARTTSRRSSPWDWHYCWLSRHHSICWLQWV